MSSNLDQAAKRELTSANLNDSWEEVMFRDQNIVGAQAPGGGGSPPTSPSPTPSVIKLLLDAQRESSSSSAASTPPPSSLTISLATTESRSLSAGQSSRTSPKYNYSPPPTTPVQLYEAQFQRENQILPADFINNDWVWDWSSRPEVVPPSDYGMRYVHPSTEKKAYEASSSSCSCASSYQQQLSWWSRTSTLLDHLPLRLFTHAFTFILGAATMFLFLKR